VQTTKIDIFFYRGGPSATEDASYVSFNPTLTPGSLVAATSVTSRESISNQVASKMALERFVEGVLEFFSSGAADSKKGSEDEKSLQILEAAFKKANSAVYQFGHKLAAGGRMSASLIGLVLEDACVAAGRAGRSSAYLARGASLFPFFDQPRDVGMNEQQAREQLVGAHSMVSVELASVTVEANDVVVAFSEPLTEGDELRLRDIVQAVDLKAKNPAEAVVRALFGPDRRVSFALLAAIGPSAIYLDRAVR
jgi:serine/threonine protein phosphatase PrpC